MTTAATIDAIRGRATVSVPEAGQVLGLGRDAAYAAAGRGELPTLKFGRRVVVPVPKLLALLGYEPESEAEGGDG